jgi:hypothetical protein
MPLSPAAAALQQADAVFGPDPAPAPNLATAPTAAALATADQVFGPQDDAPPGWTRKGILLINNQTGEKVPVRQWAGAQQATTAGPTPPDLNLVQQLINANLTATTAFGEGLKATGAPIAAAIGRIPGIRGTEAGQAMQALPASVQQELEQNLAASFGRDPGALNAAAAIGGGLAGQLAPAAIPGAYGARAAAAAAAADAAAGVVAKTPTLATIAARAATAIGGGAAIGGIYGYGSSGEGKAWEGAGQGALFGAGLGAMGAIPGVVSGLQAAEASAGGQGSTVARALNEALANDTPQAAAYDGAPPSQLYRQAQAEAQARAEASLPQDATPERVQAVVQQEMEQVDDLWRQTTGMAPPGSPEAQATAAALQAPENAARPGAPVVGDSGTPSYVPAPGFEKYAKQWAERAQQRLAEAQQLSSMSTDQLLDQLRASQEWERANPDDYFGGPPAVETIEEHLRARAGVSGDGPAELGASLQGVLGDLAGNDPIQRVVAQGAVRHAGDWAQASGWSPREVLDSALRSYAGRFSDPDDAAFMLQRLRDATSTQQGAPPFTLARIARAPALGLLPDDPRLQGPIPGVGPGSIINTGTRGITGSETPRMVNRQVDPAEYDPRFAQQPPAPSQPLDVAALRSVRYDQGGVAPLSRAMLDAQMQRSALLDPIIDPMWDAARRAGVSPDDFQAQLAPVVAQFDAQHPELAPGPMKRASSLGQWDDALEQWNAAGRPPTQDGVPALYLNPRTAPAAQPVLDDLTQRAVAGMADSFAQNNATRYTSAYEGSDVPRQFNPVAQAVRSQNDIGLPGGLVMPELGPHYLAYYRDSIPQSYQDILRDVLPPARPITAQELRLIKPPLGPDGQPQLPPWPPAGQAPGPGMPPPSAPGAINPQSGFLGFGGGRSPAQVTGDYLYDNLRFPYVTQVQRGDFLAGMKFLADQAALPDRNGFGRDLRSVYEQTGNPSIKGDTYQAALQRVMNHPLGQDGLDYLNNWRQESDQLLSQLNALRAQQGLDPIPSRANYLAMQLQDDEPWVSPTGPNIQSGRLGPEQPRAFDTLADALAADRTPVPGTEDMLGAVRATREYYARATAMRELFGKIGDLADDGNGAPRLMPDGQPALTRDAPPPGFQNASKIPMLQDLVPGDGSLYVHPELWRNLRPIITGPSVDGLGRAYDALNAIQKQAELMGSLMHPTALSESALASQPNPFRGLIQGVQENARAGMAAASHIPGLQGLRPQLFSPAEQAAALHLIDHGGVVGGAPVDAELGAFGRTLAAARDWGANSTAPLAGRPVQGLASGILHAHELNNEYLWSNLEPRLKVRSYMANRDAFDAVRGGRSPFAMGVGGFLNQRGLRNMTAQEGYRGIARAMNNSFGGQNWQLARTSLGSNPAALQALRRGFLSPDWNRSSLGAFLGPVSRNPAQRAIGINYHLNHAVYLGGLALLNKALSGHYPWQNGAGGRFDADKLFHVQWRDSHGRMFETNMGKHYMELPHVALGRTAHDLPVLGPALDKLAPPLNSAVRAAGDVKPQRGLTRAQRAGNVAADIGAPFAPINIRQGARNQPRNTNLDMGAWLRGILAPGPTSPVH